MEDRLRKIEERLSQIEQDIRVNKVSENYYNERFNELKQELKDLKSGINKLLWVFGAGVIGVFVNFILNGGLTIVK